MYNVHKNDNTILRTFVLNSKQIWSNSILKTCVSRNTIISFWLSHLFIFLIIEMYDLYKFFNIWVQKSAKCVIFFVLISMFIFDCLYNVQFITFLLSFIRILINLIKDLIPYMKFLVSCNVFFVNIRSADLILFS